MTKEEIYEGYWKQLVGLKRQFNGRNLEKDPGFLNLRKQIEQERDNLLKKHGHEPFR
jgi:hypothetical protein